MADTTDSTNTSSTNTSSTNSSSGSGSSGQTASRVLAGGSAYGISAALIAQQAVFSARTKALLLVQKPLSDAQRRMQAANMKNDTMMSAAVAALRTLAKTRDASAAKNSSLEKAASAATLGAVVAAEEGTVQAAKQALINFASLEVMYNPSSIQFNSVAGGNYTQLQGPGDGARQTLNYTRPSSTTMRVQLIFDQVNQFDAFSLYNQGLSLGSAVGVATAFTSHTVLPYVDGILGLMASKVTRHVLFIWSEMVFHGNLEGVDANFTMFNKKGQPIRATVDLSIKEADKENQISADEQYWNDAFTKAFGSGDGYTSTTTGSMTGTSTFF